jgi:D-alanyl-D-alanine carboxypeptidase (penicillin-binding protein 5/6)
VDQRTQAARDLLEWGFTQWRARPLFSAGANVGEAQVQQGNAPRVPLVAAAPVFAAMPAATSQPVRLTVHYSGPLVAPIAKGAEVGELEIAVLGQAPSRIPLYAGRDVGKAGAFDRLRNGVAGLL